MTDTYNIKAFKYTNGHDGHGYQCNLLRNNKKIATVVDDGWGGGLHFYWIDSQKDEVEFQKFTYCEEIISTTGTPEEALFEKFIMNLPQEKEIDGSNKDRSADGFVYDMVKRYNIEKTLSSKLKKNVIAEVDDKLLTFSSQKGYLLEQVMKQVQAKYPHAHILNNLSIPEVIKVYQKHKLIA